MQEKWADVAGFEGVYQISDLGNIRSLPRIIDYGTHKQTHKGRILKPQPNSKGYLRIVLTWDGKREVKFIHRLVAEAFVPNPENKPQVNHKDGNKLNNHAANLEWVNNSENQKHGRRSGLITTLHGEQKPGHKLTESDVRFILISDLSSKLLAKRFGVSTQTIYDIRKRKKWKHVQL